MSRPQDLSRHEFRKPRDMLKSVAGDKEFMIQIWDSHMAISPVKGTQRN